MATVNVQTTYSITPDAKTIAGYLTALEALKTAGAPTGTAVSFTDSGDVKVTVSDRSAIDAIADWVEKNIPIDPVPVFNVR